MDGNNMENTKLISVFTPIFELGWQIGMLNQQDWRLFLSESEVAEEDGFDLEDYLLCFPLGGIRASYSDFVDNAIGLVGASLDRERRTASFTALMQAAYEHLNDELSNTYGASYAKLLRDVTSKYLGRRLDGYQDAMCGGMFRLMLSTTTTLYRDKYYPLRAKVAYAVFALRTTKKWSPATANRAFDVVADFLENVLRGVK